MTEALKCLALIWEREKERNKFELYSLFIKENVSKKCVELMSQVRRLHKLMQAESEPT